MNYGDHNFIEITQQTKLRVALVVSSESSRAVRQARHSQNAWARHVERGVVWCRAKWNLAIAVQLLQTHLVTPVHVPPSSEPLCILMV